MAHKEIKMDVPKVKKMGKTFEDIGEVLNGISKALQILLTTLRATAFVGMFGGWALQSYIEQFKPVIDRLAKQSLEIGRDLAVSAKAYENGDAVGSTRFY
ncbi:MAG: hypothetical protein H6656_00185 [Ardenticatenaceae bacterium]|nr:hypothetical protein [Ardenticatenaceae bacterium]